MKNFKLLSTSLLAGFFSFLLYRLVFNYFLPHKISFSLSFFISVLTIIIYVKIFNLKNDKFLLQKKQKQEKENFLLALEFMTKTQQKNLFIKAFTEKELKPIRQKNYIYLSQTKTLVLIKFNEKISKLDLVSMLNHGGFDKAFIICNDFDAEIVNFSKKFSPKIVIKDEDYCYQLLKQADCLPKLPNIAIKKDKKKILNGLFYKNNAKKFFLFGVTFVVFSFFATLKLYYLIVGVAFLCFSLVLRLFGNSLKNNEETIC